VNEHNGVARIGRWHHIAAAVHLSDRIGSRLLAPIGLGIAALGLLGLTTIRPSTPYWMLAAFMALVGGGSGFFVSPNTNAIMSSVEPHV